MSRKAALELVRCAKCGSTLYLKPNGVTAGETCGLPVVAEFLPRELWNSGMLLRRQCDGKLQPIGKLS